MIDIFYLIDIFISILLIKKYSIKLIRLEIFGKTYMVHGCRCLL